MPQRTPLFESTDFTVHELLADDLPQVQALYDANPGYFLVVDGRPAQPDGARTDFDERPPAHMAYTQQWLAGVFDRQQALVGVVMVTSDLVAAGVWHIALFLIDSSLHGRGSAQAVYQALEAWCRRSGARWLRLSVIQGNTRAERFWQSRGYTELRTRPMTNGTGEVKTARVMLKPLADDGIAAYLARVPRDQRDSPLP